MLCTHRNTVLYLCLLFLLASFVSPLYATSYTGSLSYGSGLFATAEWANTDDPDNISTLTWTVTYHPESSLWHYVYELNVPSKDISHIIVEASDEGDQSFTEANLFDLEGATVPENGINTYTSTSNGNSNPLMPGEMYGIQFLPLENTTSLTVSFHSDRAPVWGDFYAKDGNKGPVVMYNTGFTANDADPDPNIVPPDNGSYEGHLLVPDTIPEPGLLTLLSLGGLGLVRKQRR